MIFNFRLKFSHIYLSVERTSISDKEKATYRAYATLVVTALVKESFTQIKYIFDSGKNVLETT